MKRPMTTDVENGNLMDFSARANYDIGSYIKKLEKYIDYLEHEYITRPQKYRLDGVKPENPAGNFFLSKNETRYTINTSE